ncbi:MAG TPA: phytanoyl-CoA dioxygenase family protein [Pyrinomonadaceae bacterium]|nr:phytanoyl-CoA dioxygenase family protein [Pyrinomonadaceae bacterium]
MDLGFEIYDAVLSVEECTSLGNALSDSKASGRAGKRHLMKEPFVESIARDERLMTLARQWVGDEATPYRATLFEKSGSANWLVVWHQDTALPLESKFESDHWGPWSSKEGIKYAHAPSEALERVIALRIHLDSSTESNGPLKVIPGSHSLGVLEDGAVFERAHISESANCLTSAGGVVAMRPLLIHASSKAQTDAPRRVLHIEYAENIEIAENIRLAIA